MAAKQCTKCGEVKPATREFFYPQSDGYLGFRPDCIPCFKVRSAAYREANRERLLLKQTEFREANREKLRASYRDFYYRNKERRLKEVSDRNKGKGKDKYLARLRKWRRENREKVQVWDRNRKARMRNADSLGTHTIDDIRELMKTQGGKCVYCKTDIRKHYHADHIIPVSKGGANDKKNLQLLCRKCNILKRDRDPHEFAQSIGYLL